MNTPDYKIKSVILHWTATRHKVTPFLLSHYNYVIDDMGDEHIGHPLAVQTPPLRSGQYAAHTLNANSNRAGIALSGMLGAKEKPFSYGDYPITAIQFRSAASLTATICIDHGITVTPKTVLTHAEVERNLGIKQRGKWDITRLPWDRDIVGATKVGNYYRERVNAELERRVTEPEQSLWGRLIQAVTDYFRKGNRKNANT